MLGMRQGAVGSRKITADFDINWPTNAKAALVIAVSHPADRPELDWWKGNGTAGNDILMRINREVSAWIRTECRIGSHPLPYHIENGGIFLKDAAVMAGLGCIGKNNLLVTPELGPRVRLRGMLIDANLAATGRIDFDPCAGCPAPCTKACPQRAFDDIVYSATALGIGSLPGRSGCYDRARCNIQMEKDIEIAATEQSAAWASTANERNPSDTLSVQFCRRCEFACPVGRSS